MRLVALAAASIAVAAFASTSSAARLNVPYLVSELRKPGQLTVVGERVFLRANGASGRSLWVSDGTGAGTFELPVGSSIDSVESSEWMRALGDLLIMRLEYAAEPGIWRSDGTTQGTYRFAELHADPRSVAVVDDVLFFISFLYESLDGPYRLWRTDGSVAGTGLLAEIDALLIFPTAYAGVLYFVNPEGNGLWRSDGSDSGSFAVEGLRARSLAAGSDGLWFYWDGALWRSDGTVAGSTRIAEIPPLASAFVPVLGRVYFLASDIERPGGYELWSSDGTAGGTRRLVRLRSTFGLWSGTGAVFVSEYNSPDAVTLWRSRGAAPSTIPVVELTGGYRRPTTPLHRGDVFYFFVVDAQAGVDHWLWVSDGTAAGTRRVAQVPLPGGDAVFESGVQAAFRGSTLFFVGADMGKAGLWAIDLESEPSCLLDCDGDGVSGASDLRAAVETALGRAGCAALAGMRARVDLLVGQAVAQTQGCAALREAD